ncbi:hypothetical protein MNBD_GAMMA25-1240 [hydrothermal vent metagenome]|uniref:Zinc finger Ogr/Delta-type domain-containing protein n=1 Tax=hydrothermal vent metagenome TaxID=652676 RepID=A0A3B1BTS7_9ZZZZ
MVSENSFNTESLDYYILGDQPTTCGKCGARTDFDELNSELQKHQCLNIQCGYEFIAVGDAN